MSIISCEKKTTNTNPLHNKLDKELSIKLIIYSKLLYSSLCLSYVYIT